MLNQLLESRENPTLKNFMQDSSRIELTVAESINLALRHSMENNPSLVTMGLGINDPKRIFGTTSLLHETFGSNRVFDFPTSENALMGFAVGLAISGTPNVSVHQRSDFFLLAMDQLVNSAAKWHYMFGSRSKVPLVVRLIVGKGWGQGPTHSQSFHAWFSHVPGLRVVMPHDSESAYRLLVEAIEEPNPVIFIEHRWLHEQKGLIARNPQPPKSPHRYPSSKTEELGDSAVTVVSFSYLSSRVRALYPVFSFLGIGIKHVILESIKPYDLDSIMRATNDTGRLLVLDFAPRTSSFAKEIVSEVVMSSTETLKQPPRVLTLPDYIQATSFLLTNQFEFSDEDLVMELMQLTGVEALSKDEVHAIISKVLEVDIRPPHDIPNPYFKGPF